MLVLYGATQRRRLWGIPVDSDEIEMYRVRNLELPVSYEKSFFLPTNLQQTLDEINPVVVIGSFDMASLIASQWCRRTGRPFVVWSEETATAFRRSGRRLMRPLRKWTRRVQLRRASGCIVPGQQSYDHIRSFGYRGLLVTAPNSIEREREFAQLGEERAGCLTSDGSGFRVLFAGSLVPNKGIDILVNNWDVLTAGSVRPIFLDVAGTGPLEKELRSSTNSRIVFHGHLTGPAYLDAFRQAHALIVPSHIDRNPLVVIEALWAGLPLIVSEGVGSWPEAVRGNGVVMHVDDLDSIRRGLATIADRTTEELLDMSRESVELAQHFSVARAIDRFRWTLQEVVRAE